MSETNATTVVLPGRDAPSHDSNLQSSVAQATTQATGVEVAAAAVTPVNHVNNNPQVSGGTPPVVDIDFLKDQWEREQGRAGNDPSGKFLKLKQLYYQLKKKVKGA